MTNASSPIAQPGNFTVNENAVLTGNVITNNGNPDTDPNGLALSTTPETLTTTSGGSLVLNADGSFTYTPVTGFYGADSFTYTLLDTAGATATGNVSINVAALPPVANNDTFTATYGQAITGNVLANDTDPNNLPLSLTQTTITTTDGNTVTLNADGSFSYTPPATFLGTDSFNYTITDGQGTATATVTLDVTPPPGALVFTSGHHAVNGHNASNQFIVANAASVTINGGAGNDTVFGDSGNVVINGGKGHDTFIGGTGNLTINGGGGHDTIYEGSGKDVINGGKGFNLVTGGSGNDIFHGGAGHDTINAGSGHALITTGAGHDVITLGSGTDTILSSGGGNTFVFQAESSYSGLDAIKGFNTHHGDTIDISNILSGYDPQHSQLSNFVELTTSGHNSILSVDTTGTGSSFVPLVTLDNQTHLSLNSLITHGQLIV